MRRRTKILCFFGVEIILLAVAVLCVAFGVGIVAEGQLGEGFWYGFKQGLGVALCIAAIPVAIVGTIINVEACDL